jgi:hypothetical protein
MEEQIQKTAYMYESSGIPRKNKVLRQIPAFTERFVRNRQGGLPSNQLQWHCQFGAGCPGTMASSKIERAALEPWQR